MANKFPGVAQAAAGETGEERRGTTALQSVAVREASGLTNCILSTRTF